METTCEMRFEHGGKVSTFATDPHGIKIKRFGDDKLVPEYSAVLGFHEAEALCRFVQCALPKG